MHSDASSWLLSRADFAFSNLKVICWHFLISFYSYDKRSMFLVLYFVCCLHFRCFFFNFLFNLLKLQCKQQSSEWLNVVFLHVANSVNLWYIVQIDYWKLLNVEILLHQFSYCLTEPWAYSVYRNTYLNVANVSYQCHYLSNKKYCPKWLQ